MAEKLKNSRAEIWWPKKLSNVEVNDFQNIAYDCENLIVFHAGMSLIPTWNARVS